MRIAIIGSGIAGMTAAYRLNAAHDITVFEASDHFGGHTYTRDIEMAGQHYAVDMGFIVFNDRTYPHFVKLLADLDVASHESSMSFSVRNERSGLEYNGTSLNRLFAQRSNLLRPSFLRMVRDIVRFNGNAPKLLASDGDEITLGDYLAANEYSRHFVDDYLVPMGAAIWSTDPQRMLAFPARFLVRFMHNHGMLSVADRPVWRVITGGSARYVERLVAPWRHRVRLNCAATEVRRKRDGVWVTAGGAGAERYDHVFFACHADEALRLLADPWPAEREILGALPFQRNEAVLHTDTSLLPRRRLAWAAWNYHVLPEHRERVALTYNMNVLQGLRSRHTLCVTLNRADAIDPARVLKRITYHHPLFTPQGIAAQRRHHEISGVARTHYCGAYWRYGFHEDGVVSAQQAVRRFEQGHHDAQRDLPRVA